MKFEDMFENLETLDAEQLITLADATDVLIVQEPYDLVMLIQELAGRLEDVLNLDVMGSDDEGKEQGSLPAIHEYN